MYIICLCLYIAYKLYVQCMSVLANLSVDTCMFLVCWGLASQAVKKFRMLQIHLSSVCLMTVMSHLPTHCLVTVLQPCPAYVAALQYSSAVQHCEQPVLHAKHSRIFDYNWSSYTNQSHSVLPSNNTFQCITLVVILQHSFKTAASKCE